MEIRRGQIVKSLAGRDKGEFQVVIKVEDKFLYLCNGKTRPLERPKKRKIIHTAATKTVLGEESLLSNRRIRHVINNFITI